MTACAQPSKMAASFACLNVEYRKKGTNIRAGQISSATGKTCLENFYIKQVKGFWLPLNPWSHDYNFKPTYRPDLQAVSAHAAEDQIGMA